MAGGVVARCAACLRLNGHEVPRLRRIQNTPASLTQLVPLMAFDPVRATLLTVPSRFARAFLCRLFSNAPRPSPVSWRARMHSNRTLIHLSDLHLSPGSAAQGELLRCLAGAIAHELRRRGAGADLLVITGDVFDSSTLPRDAAMQCFDDVLKQLRRAVGEDVPIVIQPGNHDRRDIGVLGPHTPEVFQALAQVRRAGVHIYGNHTPFLAELVPRAVHKLAAHVVAYDSTLLWRGKVGAGGLIRQEDLFQIAAELDRSDAPESDSLPLVLFIHHHLVPTPLTDLEKIAFGRMPPYLGVPLARGLPWLVANADREELTMTALGAGTALSALHSLGRAVVVLHGHKHYPTARLLRGVEGEDGDVLLCSAGSGGTVEHANRSGKADDAGIWPSFNVVSFNGNDLTVDCIAFSNDDEAKPARMRPLLAARRDRHRWEPIALPVTTPGAMPLAFNESITILSPSRDQARETWDLVCHRTVGPINAPIDGEYKEAVMGLRDAVFTPLTGVAASGSSEALGADGPPKLFQIPLGGTSSYRLQNACCRTMQASRKYFDDGTAFEWVGLLVRYGSRTARLVLRGLPRSDRRPFGSVTDLATGRDRRVPLNDADGHLVLEQLDCPARTLLRIYWALEG